MKLPKKIKRKRKLKKKILTLLHYLKNYCSIVFLSFQIDILSSVIDLFGICRYYRNNSIKIKFNLEEKKGLCVPLYCSIKTCE